MRARRFPSIRHSMSVISSRRPVVAGLALLPALVGAVFLTQQSPTPRLFKDARQMLAIARAQGRTHVSLLVAAVPGQLSAFVKRAEQMGGEVRYRDDDVEYVRVRVPIDRANELAEADEVESATVNYKGGDPSRLTPPRAQRADTVWPPRWSDYPLTNPYRAIRDIGAAEFQARNPTYDGRGITIALMDGNFDFLLPEFQTAYTID